MGRCTKCGRSAWTTLAPTMYRHGAAVAAARGGTLYVVGNAEVDTRPAGGELEASHDRPTESVALGPLSAKEWAGEQRPRRPR